MSEEEGRVGQITTPDELRRLIKGQAIEGSAFRTLLIFYAEIEGRHDPNKLSSLGYKRALELGDLVIKAPSAGDSWDAVVLDRTSGLCLVLAGGLVKTMQTEAGGSDENFDLLVDLADLHSSQAARDADWKVGLDESMRGYALSQIASGWKP